MRIFPKKKCTGCGKRKDISSEFFNRDNSRNDGFKSKCKICEKEIKLASKKLREKQNPETYLMSKFKDVRILEQIKAGLPFSTIAKNLDVSIKVVERVFYKNILKRKKVRPEPVIKVIPKKEPYWEKECQIFDSLNPTYKAEDL
jgi:hypothetical protein